MTRPEDIDLLDDSPELEPAAPEPVEEVTPPAPAEPDLTKVVAGLTDQMRQNMEYQRQQMERQNQPAAPAAWVDPYDRPEAIARLDDLEERASFDNAARAELRNYRRQLDDERLDHRVSQRENALRQELQASQQYGSVEQNLLTEAKQHGDLVQDTELRGVMNDVLGDMPAHQRAAVLQDPTMKKLLIEAAAGRRTLSGQQRPAAVQGTPEPVSVRSQDRSTPGKGKDPKAEAVQMWNDPEYLAGTMNDLFFGKKATRTQDYEDLLS